MTAEVPTGKGPAPGIGAVPGSRAVGAADRSAGDAPDGVAEGAAHGVAGAAPAGVFTEVTDGAAGRATDDPVRAAVAGRIGASTPKPLANAVSRRPCRVRRRATSWSGIATAGKVAAVRCAARLARGGVAVLPDLADLANPGAASEAGEVGKLAEAAGVSDLVAGAVPENGLWPGVRAVGAGVSGPAADGAPLDARPGPAGLPAPVGARPGCGGLPPAVRVRPGSVTPPVPVVRRRTVGVDGA